MSTYVAVFALVLAYVALVAAYCALRTLAKVRRATTVLARGARSDAAQESLIEATGRTAERVDVLAEELAALRELATAAAAVPDSSDEGTGALRNVALVRYDAFTDLTGRTSFSLAVLDEGGNGVTLSAITGRSDTRVYAKSVAGGKGEQELSPEEQQAVAAALDRRRGLLHRRAS
jgi:Protein of unknown function (DUF4446)